MLAPTTSSILGLAATLTLLAAAPASARTWAGGVDMRQACEWQYGSGWSDGVFFPYSAYDWRCINPGDPWDRRDVNVEAFCKRRYGDSAYADPQGEGKYDWGCYFP